MFPDSNNLPDSSDVAPGESLEQRLLAEHFSAQLDPHLGGARRRFEQALAAQDSHAGNGSSLRLDGGAPVSWRWTIGLITAAAACLVFGLTLWMGLDTGPTRSVVSQGSPQPGGSELQTVGYTPLEYRESWQSRDLGTYELNGRPVRAVHRQQWETATYRDPQGYQVKIEVPREQLVLVDAPVQ